MSHYRIRSTGEVKNQGEIQKMHPNVSFPKVWSTTTHDFLGIDPVLLGTQPAPSSASKTVVSNGVTQDSDGNWVFTWTEQIAFTEYTDDDGNVVTVETQLEAAERSARDELLKATDHYGLSDKTMSADMAAYRQALRDVPQQEGFPQTITWPTKPE